MITDLNGKLADAMAELAGMNAQGINIHGKRYTTVAKRVEVFRKHFGLAASVVPHIEFVDNERVRARASIQINGVEIAAGYAEEVRNATSINKTSAVEVCETSAIGRALACLGLHGGEYASANEVEHAIEKQGAAREANPTPAAKAPTHSAGRTASELDVCARSIEIALSQGLNDQLWKMHETLNENPEDYSAVGKLLSTKDRGLFKDIISGMQAERRARPSRNGRSSEYAA